VTIAVSFHIEEEDLRRQRAKARELRASQWWKRRRAKGICHWCGRRVAPAELTMDHIVPLSRGGLSTKGNVVACCKECNNQKKQMLPTEWDAYIERLRRTAAPE
jgi:5-methylcytosine-specific restriction protein A